MKKQSSLLTLLLFLSIAGPSTAQEIALAVATTSPDAPKRYIGMVEFGFLYGKTGDTNFSSSLASPTVQLFNGYRFHRLLAVGGTVGFDFYDNVLVTPMALGIRGELLKGRVSPVYGIDVGYGTTFLSDESNEQKKDGGWMFSPSAGIRVNTGNSTAYTFGLGYKTQRVKTDTNWWGGSRQDKINYKRLSVRMGFIF
ncbi:hypothetical protein [Pontibacter pamirensis]|uniref:hypothetical protein n=1 Tax=Pontibacter pamirensis TaxID=2562824 RepID=UPI001389886E|nr:hypothetical protein [Pontibacter pamirensis]